MFLLDLAQRSTPWRWRGDARTCCYAVELPLRCCLLAEHRQAQALISSSLGCHLTQDRLQDCFTRVHYSHPQWINVQEVPSDAGNTNYEDELAVLVLVHVTCLSAQ